MLRTVLLCDIVESTALIERLGDMRAVALLKRHDQLLRQLIDAVLRDRMVAIGPSLRWISGESGLRVNELR